MCSIDEVILREVRRDEPELKSLNPNEGQVLPLVSRFSTSRQFLCRLQPFANEMAMPSCDQRCHLAVLRISLTSSDVLLSYLRSLFLSDHFRAVKQRDALSFVDQNRQR